MKIFAQLSSDSKHNILQKVFDQHSAFAVSVNDLHYFPHTEHFVVSHDTSQDMYFTKIFD